MHLRYTQCSILLHLIDICFLTYICLWQISQIQTVCVCGGRTWISLDIARFYEEHCQPSSGSAWPACQKNGNWVPIIGSGTGRHNLHRVCQTAVTAPPYSTDKISHSELSPVRSLLLLGVYLDTFFTFNNQCVWPAVKQEK